MKLKLCFWNHMYPFFIWREQNQCNE